jgi:hypothetical protein
VRGFQAYREIIYMQEHQVIRDQIAKMPCKIKGISPSVIRRMNIKGIIKRKSKDLDNCTVWDRGCYYPVIMKAWVI